MNQLLQLQQFSQLQRPLAAGAKWLQGATPSPKNTAAVQYLYKIEIME
jgi:hypothetical protein